MTQIEGRETFVFWIKEEIFVEQCERFDGVGSVASYLTKFNDIFDDKRMSQRTNFNLKNI